MWVVIGQSVCSKDEYNSHVKNCCSKLHPSGPWVNHFPPKFLDKLFQRRNSNDPTRNIIGSYDSRPGTEKNSVIIQSFRLAEEHETHNTQIHQSWADPLLIRLSLFSQLLTNFIRRKLALCSPHVHDESSTFGSAVID